MKPELPWYFQKSTGALSQKGAGLFCLIFLAVGLFCLGLMTLRPAYQWLRARSWQETEAVILHSEVEESHGSDSTTYRVAVTFRYRVDGLPHQSSWYSFQSGSTNVGVDAMYKAQSELPVGKVTTCWVNPADPEEAVLKRTLPFSVFIGMCFSTPFITVGLFGLGLFSQGFVARKTRQARAALVRRLHAQGSLPAAALQRYEAGWQDGNSAVVWTAEDVRVPQVLGLGMLNLFWNGLVSVFVIIVVYEWSNGSSMLFLSLFLIPFVLVGAGMFYKLIQTLRQLFLPAWVVCLHPVPNQGGGEVQVSCAWQDAARLSHLSRCTAQIVALAAHWNRDNGGPSKTHLGARKRTRQATSHEQQLHVTEIGPVEPGRTQTLHLPEMPEGPDPEGKDSPLVKWCRWWALEILHDNGYVERVNLTPARYQPAD